MEPSVTATRFDSLGDIRKEQTRLQHLRRDSRGQQLPAEPGISPLSPDDALPAPLRAAILRYIERTAAAGTVLADESERWAAQSILDYWTTLLDRAGVKPPDGLLASFDPNQLPEIPDDKCPFVGLDAFGELQADRFCGRGAATQELLEFVHRHRLVAVVGASGSGKSSLVLAGLLPALRAESAPSELPWEILPTLVPGEAPEESLRTLIGDPNEARSGTSSAEILLSRHEGKRLLLVIDQFEELFTVCESAERRQMFAKELVQLATAPSAGHTVVLTIRSDFEQQVASLPELHSLYREGRFALGVMMEEDLREAIEKPARAVNLRFEEGLVKQILRDVSAESAALPLLQFTLLQLWNQRQGNLVRRESYEALGGAAGAVTKVADRVYANLKLLEKQEVARRIFLRLTYPKEGRFDVFRQRLRRSEIIRDENPQVASAVIQDFVDARLIRRVPGKTADSEQIEVAHEALVRNWRTLLGWLEDQKHDVATRRRLDFMVEEWIRLGESDAGCLDEVQLREAKDWVASDKAKLHGYHKHLPDLIAKSAELIRNAAERQARQRRIAQTIVFGVSLTLGSVALVSAVRSERKAKEAQTEKKTAEDNLELAKFKHSAVLAMRLISDDPLQALQQARRSNRAPNYEARTALYRALSRPLPHGKLSGHSAAINRLEVSPDGKYILTAAEDKSARLWKLDGSPLASLQCHFQGLNGARFHPNFPSTSELLTYADDGRVLLWTPGAADGAWKAMDVSTGEPAQCNPLLQSTPQQPSQVQQTGVVDDIAPVLWAEWSPDGQFVAMRDDTGKLKYRSSKDFEERFAPLEGIVRTYFLPGEGAQLIWFDKDKNLSLCNLATGCQPLKLGPLGLELESFERQLSRTGVVTAQDSARASAGVVGKPRPGSPLMKEPAVPARIFAWDRSGQPLLGREGFAHDDLNSVSDVGWSPDGSLLLTIGKSKSAPLTDVMALWRIEKGSLVKVPFGQPALVNGPPLGKSVSVPEGVPRVAREVSEKLTVSQARFSPDGKYIVSCGSDKRVFLYEQQAVGRGYRLTQVLGPFARAFTRCLFSGDGTKILLSVVGEPGVQIWNVAGHYVQDLAGQNHELVPRSSLFFTQSASQERMRWQLERSLIPMLSGPLGAVNRAAADKNETMLVTTSGSTVLQWNEKGEHIGRPRRFEAWIDQLSVSPEGRYVLIGTSDIIDRSFQSRCWLWDLSPKADATKKDSLDRDPVELVGSGPDSPLRCFHFQTGGKTRIGGLNRHGVVVQWSSDGTPLPTKIDPQLSKGPQQFAPVTVSFAESGDQVVLTSMSNPATPVALLFGWNGQKRADLPRSGTSFAVEFSDANGDFVTLDDKAGISRWSAQGKLQPALVMPDPKPNFTKSVLSVSRSGQFVAASDATKSVWLWDTKTPGPPDRLRHEAPVKKMAIQESVGVLVTETENEQIVLWDLRGSLEEPIRKRRGKLLATAPDGLGQSGRPWLFTQESDGSVLLWYVKKGEAQRFALVREDWPITELFVSPGGGFVVPMVGASSMRYINSSSGPARRSRVSHRWPLDESTLSKLADDFLRGKRISSEVTEELDKQLRE